jgi:hypothetical protein
LKNWLIEKPHYSIWAWPVPLLPRPAHYRRLCPHAWVPLPLSASTVSAPCWPPGPTLTPFSLRVTPPHIRPTPSPFLLLPRRSKPSRAPVLPFIHADRPRPSLGSNHVTKPHFPFCPQHPRPRPLLRAGIQRNGAATHHTLVRTTSKSRFPILFVAANSSLTPLSPRA